MVSKEAKADQNAFYFILHVGLLVSAAFILHYALKNAIALYKAWSLSNNDIKRKFGVIYNYGMSPDNVCDENGYCDDNENYITKDTESLQDYFNRYNKNTVRDKMALQDSVFTDKMLTEDLKEVVDFKIKRKVDAQIDKMPTQVIGTRENQIVVPDASKLSSSMILTNEKEDVYNYDSKGKEDTNFFTYLLSASQIQKSRQDQQTIIDSLATKIKDLENYYRR